MGMGGGLCQWGDVMKVRHCLGEMLNVQCND
jgi:pentatricopeptide repeat protein